MYFFMIHFFVQINFIYYAIYRHNVLPKHWLDYQIWPLHNIFLLNITVNVSNCYYCFKCFSLCGCYIHVVSDCYFLMSLPLMLNIVFSCPWIWSINNTIQYNWPWALGLLRYSPRFWYANPNDVLPSKHKTFVLCLQNI